MGAEAREREGRLPAGAESRSARRREAAERRQRMDWETIVAFLEKQALERRRGRWRIAATWTARKTRRMLRAMNPQEKAQAQAEETR